mmetsp:Transcript_3371/g.13387  ORF Transcript_3371/g.13387 Transcript_3371/m.13387 type:complete len:247 (+) Transcript_3371:1094-1834(+)
MRVKVLRSSPLRVLDHRLLSSTFTFFGDSRGYANRILRRTTLQNSWFGVISLYGSSRNTLSASSGASSSASHAILSNLALSAAAFSRLFLSSSASRSRRSRILSSDSSSSSSSVVGVSSSSFVSSSSSASSASSSLALDARTRRQAGESEQSARIEMLTCRRRLFRLLPPAMTMPSSSSLSDSSSSSSFFSEDSEDCESAAAFLDILSPLAGLCGLFAVSTGWVSAASVLLGFIGLGAGDSIRTPV